MKTKTYQNSWSAIKTVIREKFIVVNACVNKKKRFQINNLTFHLHNKNKIQQSKSKQQN